MNRAQYRRIREVEGELWTLYSHTAVVCHMSHKELCDAREERIKAAGKIANYARYGLYKYSRALKRMFEHNHIVQVYDTPSGRLEVGSPEYVEYVNSMPPKDFYQQDNPLLMVYRDNFDKVYFA